MVRAASSYNTAESRKTKEGSNLNINATNFFVFYSRKHLRKILALIPLLGNVAWETKIFLPFTKINLVDATTRGECDLRTLVDR